MKERIPDSGSEQRLEALRAEALEKGRVEGRGVRPQGSPMPDPEGDHRGQVPPDYYGQPLLKPPVWTWEVPLYFFVGGAAGASAVVAVAAQLGRAEDTLVRDARWVACIGAGLSAPLLIADLGRPERFLNMLRVFKPQSAMSVGAWTVAIFGGAATAAALTRTRMPLVGNAAAMVAAMSGLVMTTYTGVLLGATSIPVWSSHVRTLPIHFGASALASSVSILQLRGHDEIALQILGLAAAAFESHTAFRIETDSRPVSTPLRTGPTGSLVRLGAFFSGPLPLLLRLVGARSRPARRAAAVASILGSIVTRFAWVEAGKNSARDPQVALGTEEVL